MSYRNLGLDLPIQTKNATDAYREGWDRIFGQKEDSDDRPTPDISTVLPESDGLSGDGNPG